MDKFNHWLGKLFGFVNGYKYYAVTFGQTTYYSCEECFVTVYWRVHENTHKKQYEQDGWVKFLSRYVFQLCTKGYKNIDYEIEARFSAYPFGGPPV